MEKLRRLSDDLKSSFDSQSSQTAFHKLPNETSDFCIDDNDGEDEDEENNRRYKDYPSSASNSSSLEMTAYHDHGGSGASDPRQVELTFDDEGVDTQNHIPLSGYCFNPRTERRRDQWIVSMLLLLQVMLIVLFDVLSINHKLLDFLLFIYVFAGVPFVWVWERLFRQPHFLFEEERTATICGGRFTKHNVTKFTFATTILYGFLSFTFSYFYSSSETKPYIVLSYTIFGGLLNLMTSVLIWDIITFFRFLKITYHNSHVTQPLGGNRRLTIVKRDYVSETRAWYKLRAKLTWVTYFTILGLSLHHGYSISDNLNVEVLVEDLPECLDGYKIGMLSDVHAGPVIGKAGIKKHVEALNVDEPDLILLAGDMADGPDTQVGKALEPIFDMVNKPRDGIYFVTGNHEYLHGGDGNKWMQFWESHGVKALNNEMVSIPPRNVRPLAQNGCNSTFDLAGTSDYSEGGSDINKAVSGFHKDSLHVLVAHQPREALRAGELTGDKQIHLQISGHVHAGQIFPLHIFDYNSNKGLFTGFQVVKNTKLYVGEGTVGWGPRNRLFSSNERTILTMKKRAEDINEDLLEKQEDRGSFVWGLRLAWIAVVLQFVSCLGLVCSPPARKLLSSLCGIGRHGARGLQL